jgi:hypothetical protein
MPRPFESGIGVLAAVALQANGQSLGAIFNARIVPHQTSVLNDVVGARIWRESCKAGYGRSAQAVGLAGRELMPACGL